MGWQLSVSDPALEKPYKLFQSKNSYAEVQITGLESIDNNFLDKLPTQDNWEIRTLTNFSTYPTIYNLICCNQDYNEQPVYEIDCNYSGDSDSDYDIT